MLIKPYEKNAKKHDRVQIENVKESIRQFGMVQPIVVDNEGTIIIGHCRFIALLEMGYKADNLPENFFIVKDLTDKEANKLRLLDNKLNESEWNKVYKYKEITT